MRQRIYVALDLETTGLNPRRHQIIEVAAVRFQGGYILDRFSSLVNPGFALPLEIQQLTGITDDLLATAPTLDAVLPELRSFVDRQVAATVAHNAGFDLGFLKAAGVEFHRPSLDTYELATILRPGCPSYSLGQLCLAEGIPLVDAHRALDDASATAQLFDRLLDDMDRLPRNIIDTLIHCGTFGQRLSLFSLEDYETSQWPLLPLFQEASGIRQPAHQVWHVPVGNGTTGKLVGETVEKSCQTIQAATVRPSSAPNPSTEAEARRAAITATTDKIIEQVLGTDGPLAQLVGGAYEHRSGQITMAKAVYAALEQGDHLLIEAGTGTGKSLAYLLAAALWARQSGERVVIATNTLALQEQLLDKEFPQLQAILEHQAQTELTTNRPSHFDGSKQRPLKVALLKGRNHYLCTRRLRAWASGRALSNQEMNVLAKVLIWLPTTQSGDGSELILHNHGAQAIWSDVCSEATTCSVERCRPDRAWNPQAEMLLPGLLEGNIDFYHHARQQSEEADIVIVNHALLLADIANGGRILPSYQHLIIDEGHRLEEVATQQFTYRADWHQLQRTMQRLDSRSTLMLGIRGLLRGETGETIYATLLEMDDRGQRLLRALKSFADQLAALCAESKDGQVDLGYAQRIHVTGGLRAQPEWSQIEIRWGVLSAHLAGLLEQGWSIIERMENAQWLYHEPHSTHFSELQGILEQIQTFTNAVDGILLHQRLSADENIAWLEISNSTHTLALQIAPAVVNDLLEESLIRNKKSVIVTGATLNGGDDFQYIKNQLGFHDAASLTVESPFNYAESTQLLLPQDMPSPSHHNYQSAVEQAIIAAALASGGRTLVLFTNNRQLRETANAIRGPLYDTDIRVLEQGGGSRRHLLREYRQSERAVLLGTRTFWEGIDLPGDELVTLLIVRLPFAVPDDPIVLARSSQFDDPFGEYSVPNAVLRFRQGFGRLIRRRTDRGTVVVLDSRLWEKAYGQIFLDALPACTTKVTSLVNISEEIEEWMSSWVS